MLAIEFGIRFPISNKIFQYIRNLIALFTWTPQVIIPTKCIPFSHSTELLLGWYLAFSHVSKMRSEGLSLGIFFRASQLYQYLFVSIIARPDWDANASTQYLDLFFYIKIMLANLSRSWISANICIMALYLLLFNLELSLLLIWQTPLVFNMWFVLFAAIVFMRYLSHGLRVLDETRVAAMQRKILIAFAIWFGTLLATKNLIVSIIGSIYPADRLFQTWVASFLAYTMRFLIAFAIELLPPLFVTFATLISSK